MENKIDYSNPERPTISWYSNQLNMQLTGGRIVKIAHNRQQLDVVEFAERPNGKTMYAMFGDGKKPELDELVKEYQKAISDAKNHRQAKLDGIEGLEELKNAINVWDAYHAVIERRMNDEHLSSFAPAKPEVSIAELMDKYPRAKAYLTAEAWSYASHYAKASAGRKALSRILDGQDYQTAIAEMEAEWDKHVTEHMFD